MKELRDTDKTIVIVSHSLNTVKELCTRAIWLYKGEEYVLTGLSINSSNSEKLIISSILLSISFLLKPKIDALKYMFSLPVKSG